MKQRVVDTYEDILSGEGEGAFTVSKIGGSSFGLWNLLSDKEAGVRSKCLTTDLLRF